MMKQRGIAVLVLVLVLSAAGSAFALGVGFGTTGGMSYNIATKSHEDDEPSKAVALYTIGATLILDTAVAKNELFNYRLNLGYNNLILKDMGFFSRHSTHRIIWCNTFGIGLYRTDAARIYTGPQLALSYDFEYNSNGNSGIDNPLLMGYFGLVMGFNIHSGKHITFTMDFGGRVGYGGFVKIHNLKVTRLEPFANIGVLYRVGDSFSSEEHLTNPKVETIQDLIDRENREKK